MEPYHLLLAFILVFFGRLLMSLPENRPIAATVRQNFDGEGNTVHYLDAPREIDEGSVNSDLQKQQQEEAYYADLVAKAGQLLNPPEGFAKDAEKGKDFNYKKVRGKLIQMAKEHLSRGQFQTHKSRYHNRDSEDPLVEVYDQGFHGNCWAHSGASYLHAVFLRWFEEDDIGLSQLMPFEFVKNDTDIHNVLLYISTAGEFHTLSGGSLMLFLYRISPILGALLALFGPKKHHDIASDWMNHGLFKRIRHIWASGEEMNNRIAELQQEIPLPYVLHPSLPTELDPNASHAVVLVKEKQPGLYQALNSWGKGRWDPAPEYENRRQPDDEPGRFTIDFVEPVELEAKIETIAPQELEIDPQSVFESMKSLIQYDLINTGGLFMNHVHEFVSELKDVLPKGFQSIGVSDESEMMLGSAGLTAAINECIEKEKFDFFSEICDVVPENPENFPEGLDTKVMDGQTVRSVCLQYCTPWAIGVRDSN